MGFGVGIVLVAVGAVLAWAVNVDTGGAVDLNTVGYILLIVGIVAVLASLVFWSSWGGFGGRDSGGSPQTNVVED